jgi:hypothetical protein
MRCCCECRTPCSKPHFDFYYHRVRVLTIILPLTSRNRTTRSQDSNHFWPNLAGRVRRIDLNLKISLAKSSGTGNNIASALAHCSFYGGHVLAFQKWLMRAARQSASENLASVRIVFLAIRSRFADWRGIVPHVGNDRTAYVIGLGGSGRSYLVRLLLVHIGIRAWNYRNGIRLHPGPTSMIYTGHPTIRFNPDVSGSIFEAVSSGIADLIFVYRHPLDSLLTNWVWWRTTNLDSAVRTGDFIETKYKNTDDLCAELEKNFLEFRAFAEGHCDVFAARSGQRFWSLAEFIEETESYINAATISLRFEDFMIDPVIEFSKIAKVMSVDLDLSRIRIARPRTKPYRFLTVKASVPQFRDFVDGLDSETKKRIGRMGYSLSAEGEQSLSRVAECPV